VVILMHNQFTAIDALLRTHYTHTRQLHIQHSELWTVKAMLLLTKHIATTVTWADSCDMSGRQTLPLALKIWSLIRRRHRPSHTITWHFPSH
jgi:disulfide bond formation protein DsbB